jgi:NADPH:quinone reductase-like Zn-dependent oxidoreductase
MKAIVQTGYGSPDGFELREIDKPQIKKADDVLVRVHAAALHAGDVFMMRGVPYFTRLVVGFPKPRNYIPGYDMAGRVEAVGKGVTQFQPGDEVYGSIGRTCAEFARAPEDQLERKPANLSMEQAAAVPTSAIAALQGIRDAGAVKPGQKVLINGASGGVGTFAVQIAKAYGAEVTGVCSTRHVERIRSIGADHVIDYTKEDFTENGEIYDVIFDVVGMTTIARGMRSLSDTGVYLMANPRVSQTIRGRLASRGTHKRIVFGTADYTVEHLDYLKKLVEVGELKIVIDRTYPLEQTAEAHTYVETGQKAGNVVIRVSGG